MDRGDQANAAGDGSANKDDDITTTEYNSDSSEDGLLGKHRKAVRSMTMETGISENNSMYQMQSFSSPPTMYQQPRVFYRNGEPAPTRQGGPATTWPGGSAAPRSGEPALKDGQLPREYTELLATLASGEHGEVMQAVTSFLAYADGEINFNKLVDEDGNTLLHLAAKNNLFYVTEKLLDHDFTALAKNDAGETPLEVALKERNDDVAAFIVRYMDNASVRLLFKRASSKARLNIQDYLNNDFEKAASAILDCCLEKSVDGTHEVHYDILEADECGYEPTKKEFDPNMMSAFQMLVKEGNMNLINHDVVRLLIDKKWSSFAGLRFLCYAIIYLLSLFCLTVSVVTSVSSRDVIEYGSTDTARAMFEVVAYIYICARLFLNVVQLVMNKSQYFKDKFNMLELVAAILLVCVVPVRYTHVQVHWYIFSAGYFLWVLLIFKYAVMFKETGKYAQILYEIIRKDVLQFAIIFIVINIAFSGTFLLALKGDMNLDTHVETSSFWYILFLDLRTITDGSPIVSYTGQRGYRPFSSIIMLVFIFVALVILLNILIAQMNDTYQKIQEKAYQNLEVNKAQIIFDIEQHDLPCLDKKLIRRKHYHPRQTIIDLKVRHDSLLERITDSVYFLKNKQIKNEIDIETVKTDVKKVKSDVVQFLDTVTENQKTTRKLFEHVTDVQETVSEFTNDYQRVHNDLDSLHHDYDAVKKTISNVAELLSGKLQLPRYETRGFPRPLADTSALYGDIELVSANLRLYQNPTQPDNAALDMFASEVAKNLGNAIKSSEQHKVLGLVNAYIESGASLQEADTDGYTALHHAAQMNYYFVAEKLLDNNADTLAKSNEGKLPLQIALADTANGDTRDETAALIVKHMDNTSVKKLFLRSGTEEPPLKLSDYLTPGYEKTALAILDCMLERNLDGSTTVYYNLLDADMNGCPRNENEFNQEQGTIFHMLADRANTNVICHKAVRLLIKRKWTDFARTWFVGVSILYLLSLAALTYTIVTSVFAADVTTYDSPLQYARAIFEILSYIFALVKFVTEIIELKRLGSKYFHDLFNWIESSSSILLLCVLPVRYAHEQAHWYLYSIAYFMWILTIFKYAAVFRQTGAYAQILWQIIINDVLQFAILFAVVNMAFGGSFLLTLRGDGGLHIHNETSSYWGVLFVGVRTMVESGPVVEYTGSNGYWPVSTIIMLVFLFVTVVILLNILIAQLSDTYQKIQSKASMNLETNLARIITRKERADLNFIFKMFCKQQKSASNYVEKESIGNVGTLLVVDEKSEENEIYDTVQYLEKKQLTNQLHLQTTKRQTNGIQKDVAVVKEVIVGELQCLQKVESNLESMKEDFTILKGNVPELRIEHEILALCGEINDLKTMVKDLLNTVRSKQDE